MALLWATSHPAKALIRRHNRLLKSFGHLRPGDMPIACRKALRSAIFRNSVAAELEDNAMKRSPAKVMAGEIAFKAGRRYHTGGPEVWQEIPAVFRNRRPNGRRVPKYHRICFRCTKGAPWRPIRK